MRQQPPTIIRPSDEEIDALADLWNATVEHKLIENRPQPRYNVNDLLDDNALSDEDCIKIVCGKK